MPTGKSGGGGGGAGGPSKPTGGRGVPRPKPKRAQGDFFFERMAQDGNTLAYSCVCLSLLASIMFASGIALIIVGSVLILEDLILVGALFVAGGLLFVIMLILNVLYPACKRNTVGVYDPDREPILDNSKGVANDGFLEDYGPDPFPELPHKDDRPRSVTSKSPVPSKLTLPSSNMSRNTPEPSQMQLYEYTSGTTSPGPPATPTTAADVHMGVKMGTEAETPPPPSRMVSPDDPALNSPAVYYQPPSAMTKIQKGVSDLETL